MYTKKKIVTNFHPISELKKNIYFCRS